MSGPFEDAKDSPAPSVVSVWPALLVMALGAVGWIVAGGYAPEGRQFPRIVAAILVVLGAIDLWSRLDLPGRRVVADVWGASFRRREMPQVPPLRAELGLGLWVLGAFAGVALIGILPALPLFCLAFIRLRARRGLTEALVIAAGLFVFEIAVFEWLLDYELYRGLLFSKGGFSRW